jgi:SNF2 family DNA or RNA helicase
VGLALSDLYRFQEEGARWLSARSRGYLADSCGLGKTVQACYAAQIIKPRSVLVQAPAMAIANWYREWKEWGVPKIPFAVVSYAGRDIKAIRGEDWDLVISDEAHYCKSTTALRTRRALDNARKARVKWFLSATPMPNNLAELYPVLRVIWPEIAAKFGITDYQQWVNHFCRWTDTVYGPYIYANNAANERQLRKYLKAMMLRRTDEDVDADIPELRCDVSLLPRDEGFARSLQEFGLDADALSNRMDYEWQHVCRKCDGTGWRSEIEECSACEGEGTERGSSSRLRRLIGEYKTPRIADIIAEELRTQQYSKIVIFAYHKSTIAMLRTKLERYNPVTFDGGTNRVARAIAEDTFRDDPSVHVFIGQTTAAGVSLNLQVANECVIVEPSRTPDEDYQAMKRINRIGSTRPCRARLFGVAGTYDETILRGQAAKIRMQAGVGLERRI